MYKIEWKKTAVKELKNLSKADIKKILRTAEGLKENPYPPACKKLKCTESLYRAIEIVKVGHRKNVYRF